MTTIPSKPSRTRLDGLDDLNEDEMYAIDSSSSESATHVLETPGNAHYKTMIKVEPNAPGIPADAIPPRSASPQPTIQPKVERQRAVEVEFVCPSGFTIRKKPWTRCCTIDTLIMQVAAARMTESIENQFVLVATVDGVDVSLAKDDPDDFEELRAMIETRMAQHSGGELERVVVRIRLLAELKSAA